ncbi:MAG: methyltransferase family protein [Candidatus Acidiferrales bacterium]
MASKRASLNFVVFSAIYILAMLACLRQWGSADPWSRLDRFSGGYILASVLWVAASLRFFRFVSGPKDVAAELTGASYDKKLFAVITGVSLAELLVFVDYGHWHLMPALEKPALQAAGIVLSLLALLWLVWTDRYLLAHFSAGLTQRKVISGGPYRLVRHPRYFALIVSRIAFALALASPIAWGFLVVWIFAIARRIRLEEEHLRDVFGVDYAEYASRTARLIPGVF